MNILTPSRRNQVSFQNRNLEVLDNDRLRRAAPSIFAGQAQPGVSHRYSFLPTSEVVEAMRADGWAPVQAFEQRVNVAERQGFQKHVIRFQRLDHIDNQTLGHRPEVVLLNSHDRSSAYQLHAGIFRLVCSNGMIIADGTFAHVSIRHSGFQPQQVIDAGAEVLRDVPRLMDGVRGYQDRQLSIPERQAFAEAALLLRYDSLDDAPIAPAKVLEHRRSEDNGRDLWTTMNVVQENMIRGGLKDYSRRKPSGKRFARTRAIAGIDENVKLNKALWHLAETLKNR